MKRIIITNIIAIVMLMVTVQLNAREIVKQTESFIISTSESVEFSKNFERSWTIAYGDDNKQINVYKNTTRNGDEYIVRNKFFEVRYVNAENGFGVKKMKNSQMLVDPLINSAVVSEIQMKQQALLSPNKLDEEKALNYIASFVPFLLNENYTHILN